MGADVPPTRRPYRYAVWTAALAVLLPFLLVVTTCLHGRSGDAPPARTFDAAAWQADEAGRGDVRRGMVDDLLDGGSLHGRTRRELVALLGPPDREGAEPVPAMVWRVGNRRGLRPGSAWLTIELEPGDEGVVRRYFVWSGD